MTTPSVILATVALRITRRKKKKINTKNSGLPKLLRWSHALRSDQNWLLLICLPDNPSTTQLCSPYTNVWANKLHMVSEEIVRLTHYCFSFKFYFPNTFLIRISFQIGPHWTILLDIKILSFQEKELYQTTNLKKTKWFLGKLSNIVLEAQFCWSNY